MVDEAPKASSWWVRHGAKIAALLGAFVAGVIGNQQCRKPHVERVVEQAKPAGYAPTQGWVKDDGAIAENLNPLKTTQFDATPAGRAVLAANEDVLLWRATRKAAGKASPWFFNVNQENVGCCVGCGFAHGVGILLGVQVAGGVGEWKPVAVEAIYSLSRVEIGGGKISGDGSVGAWAARAIKEYGVVPMEVVGNHDLTTFSPARARSWGRSGCPDDLEPKAREHPVKGIALVKTSADVEKAIRQGYPVPVCSDQGFRMERDATGRCAPQGTWYHCMCAIGVRTLGGRTQFFILNSWGDDAHTGPVVPDDAPPAGFWADASVVDKMVRQGDSFALSDAAGFPERKPRPLDWDIRKTTPRPNRHPFDEPLFALAH